MSCLARAHIGTDGQGCRGFPIRLASDGLEGRLGEYVCSLEEDTGIRTERQPGKLPHTHMDGSAVVNCFSQKLCIQSDKDESVEGLSCPSGCNVARPLKPGRR